MLSDEEKEAIKYIKNILNYEKLYCHDGIETNFLRPVDKENVKIVLNLIEKQSKEIEELKEENEKYKNPPFFDEDNYTENDKIKAKIEEYERNKRILEEKSQGIFSSLDEMGRIDINIKFYDTMIKEMQSLLEKE